jgi:hypothetical protein
VAAIATEAAWPEKIREVERLRPSLEVFRQMRVKRDVTPAGPKSGQCQAGGDDGKQDPGR